MISPIKKLSHIAPIIEYSHERYNGSGYPYGVAQEEIPLGARIVSVADSFSAMMDERPYKKPMQYNDAVDEIRKNSGILYDPKVVSAFFEILDQPNGGNKNRKPPDLTNKVGWEGNGKTKS